MAKSNFRFAVPSQLDSDDEGSDGQNAAHSGTSSKFKPGQMFAQKKTDNTVTSTKPAVTSKATVTSLSANLSGGSSTASAPSSASATLAPFTATKAPSSTTPTVPTDSTATSVPTAQSSASSAPSAVRSGTVTKNAIIVNTKQRGNPILKHVTNVAYEYGDIAADYQVGSTSCVLYLSLRYHNLNPDYIQKRLDDLRNMYELRVLLAQVDVKDPHHSLKELALLCILTNFTLIVAWSPEEAGRYLETYKIYENKPPDAIMSRPEGDFQGQVADALTTVKGVNKTDATTLLTTFDSFANIVQADEEKLLLCPGLGPLKAKRLHQLFETPFTNWK